MKGVQTSLIMLNHMHTNEAIDVGQSLVLPSQGYHSLSGDGNLGVFLECCSWMCWFAQLHMSMTPSVQ